MHSYSRQTAPEFAGSQDHLFREASVRPFWCTPDCDCCVHTGPYETHSNSKFDQADLSEMETGILKTGCKDQTLKNRAVALRR